MSRWLLSNPDKAKRARQPSEEAKRRYASSQRGKEIARLKTQRWVANNPQRVKELRLANYVANRDRHIQKVVDRCKRLALATPPWADRKRIAELYAKARALTRATGVEYQVDHVIPLNGRAICGLHVHQNLRIITAAENRSKGAKIVLGVL